MNFVDECRVRAFEGVLLKNLGYRFDVFYEPDGLTEYEFSDYGDYIFLDRKYGEDYEEDMRIYPDDYFHEIVGSYLVLCTYYPRFNFLHIVLDFDDLLKE